ncbi:PIN domain-containing protein [Nocardia thraciensis]
MHEDEPLIVVDAANVVGSRPDGWWRDRAGAARRLLLRLSATGQLGDIVVVLEGAARAAAGNSGEFDTLRVVSAAGSGDDAIVAEVAAARPPVTVVTADRGLRARVEALGARTVGPRWLLDRLEP